MGILADITGRKLREPNKPGLAAWRRTFGTAKEDAQTVKVTPDGGQSLVGTVPAVKRLIDALRSKAPGGWSDDRWAESNAWRGITYIAGHRIATQLAQSEFQVFHNDPSAPEGKRAVTPQDPPEGGRPVKPYDLVKLLKHPNPQDSWGSMVYRWSQQRTLTGTALTWMVPNAYYVPMELYPIPTALAIPQAVQNDQYPQGYYRIQPVYPYGPFSSFPTPATSVGAPIPAQWMMRFQYPHPILRYDGFSPLTALNTHVDEVNSIDFARWYAMKRGVAPSAVLNFEAMEGLNALPPEEIARIRAEFANEFQGPQNAGVLHVATPGAKLEPWGVTPDKMMYESGWDQLTSFILGGLGITKPAAGMVEDSSYSTLFATLKQLNLLTLEPECQEYASQLTRQLAPFYGDDLIVEIRCRRIDDHDVANGKIDKLLALKGAPKAVIRVSLNLMDIPADTELVEELAAAGDQMGAGMPGAPGMPPAGANDAAPPPPPLANQPGAGEPEEGRDEPLEVTQSRPKPGKLGEGALGPRKSYERRLGRLRRQAEAQGLAADVLARRKGLYELLHKSMGLNGNGH